MVKRGKELYEEILERGFSSMTSCDFSHFLTKNHQNVVTSYMISFTE